MSTSLIPRPSPCSTLARPSHAPVAHGRSWRAVAAASLLAGCAFASPHAAATVLHAFGQGSIAIPSNTATGTVVARQYYTPTQLCGNDTCEIVRVSLYANGQPSAQAAGPDLETNVPGLSTRLLVDGRPVTSSTLATLRGTAEIQLFRDSRTPRDTTPDAGMTQYYEIVYRSGAAEATAAIHLSAQTGFINGTCSVPDQTVTLPTVSQNTFHGVGSTAGSTDFLLRLNQCPAGYNRIGYQLSPVDGFVAGTNGTLALRPDSTAAGIGVQVSDGATGNPLQLQRSYAVAGYDTRTGGSPAIPLRAAYVQTGSTIVGGSVHAAAQVLLDYQ
ncbi:fimbrial protein [Burkholderia anthina]|uniref:Fimbrial protein n=1 Tax=Burkholderia anthina TaxID=179879 RepID=A0A6P2G932_9BURK|nr:fimbrial protein [Burkholderia anthina]MBM2770323.1 type 1 fimbrial protein [Burkholderia anthina]VVU49799.1 fimbrial protein [Burkholderia anthina]